MASKTTSPATNGEGARRCTSWIESFVEYTSNTESAITFRRWAAISTIAAVLEQKVWVTTSHPLYPNLYVFLVAFAGYGKSRAISTAMSFAREIPEMHLGATSMTMASMVDHMAEAKRVIINIPDPAIEYNSLYVSADELSAFMHKYDSELVAGLTTFYDTVPYSQGRRVRDIRIKINKPQLNLLSGTTPSNLLNTMPEAAWEQGLTSRIILVYSEERKLIDVFNTKAKPKPVDMIHDLKIINSIVGEFGWTDAYAKAMQDWRTLGCPPVPEHPKLENYNTRRFAHLIKLSMISSIDRGNSLMLEVDDFNRAAHWLIDAEKDMPAIFKSGAASQDSKAMDEIMFFVKQAGDKGISEHRIMNFARTRIQYAHNIANIVKAMEQAGMLHVVGVDKLGLRVFSTDRATEVVKPKNPD